MKALVVYESMFGNTEQIAGPSPTDLANRLMCTWSTCHMHQANRIPRWP
jgi:hypothetical protein